MTTVMRIVPEMPSANVSNSYKRNLSIEIVTVMKIVSEMPI
jgi:hypothetical protein